MGRTLFILSLIIFSFKFTLAQNDCKFDYSEEDKVTGKKVSYFDYTIGMGLLKIRIGNDGNQCYFSIGMDCSGEKFETVRPDIDTLFIRLSNNELIKLCVKTLTKPTIHIIRNQIFSIYQPIYYLNEAQLKLLSESPIVAFRFTLEGKASTFEIPQKKANQMTKDFNCLKLNQ